MLMFTLAISCLTTFTLTWCMDLIFQVPMQYCSLCNRTLLPLPVTTTTGHCFCFGYLFILSAVISPLFSSSISGTYRPGQFIFQCPIFLLFILFMGFSRQEYWNSFQFPSPVDHILSELSTNNTREDSTHGQIQMVDTKIRLIIFFAAKGGEALYSQQKQDQELTVAQIMNSLLPNST